jgi:hypothetical protein
MVDLLPYSGSRIAEHFGERQGGHTRVTYGEDTSGSVTYRFNSLGFRGKEYSESASTSIFVCGASDTFGTGVDEEATWPRVFSAAFSRQLMLHDADLNLMNFSEGGCCNAYITRTLMQQCHQRRPNLVIAHYTFISRQESFIPATVAADIFPFSLNSSHVGATAWGKWLDVGFFRRESALLRVPPNARPWSRKLTKRTNTFFRDYDVLQTAYSTIQNMLLLQYYLKSNAIEYLMCVHDLEILRSEEVRSNILLERALAMLDRSRVLTFAISDDQFQIDLAADGSHQGVSSNREFGESVWKEYLTRVIEGQFGN